MTYDWLLLCDKAIYKKTVSVIIFSNAYKYNLIRRRCSGNKFSPANAAIQVKDSILSYILVMNFHEYESSLKRTKFMKKNLVHKQSEFAINKAVHELIEFYQSS